jgi:hypothetical protein
MRSYLRVKIKSLAVEARIIRHEERRLLGRNTRAAPRETTKGALIGPGPGFRAGGVIPYLRSRQTRHYVSNGTSPLGAAR